MALHFSRSGGIPALVGLAVLLAQFVSGSTEATLDQFLDHIDHFARLVGPAHVGIGPDCMEQ